MCLGVPGRVLEVRGNLARVDFFGVQRDTRLDLVDERGVRRLHTQPRGLRDLPNPPRAELGHCGRAVVTAVLPSCDLVYKAGTFDAEGMEAFFEKREAVFVR
jgi:hypothetical protein